MNRNRQERSVGRSVQEYLRGIVGGLLFSLPLLYTMEVWWAGYTMHPVRLLLYVLATFTLLLGYNRYGGLRCDASPAEVAIDSVEEMGIGIAISTVVLWLLGQLTFSLPISEVVGKIATESMTVAIGVSVGTAQLGGDSKSGDTGMENEPSQAQSHSGPFLSLEGSDISGQLAIATCGSVLFAANVAPTEEIFIIATQSNPYKLIGMALLSMLLGTIILFYSNFNGAQSFSQSRGIKNVLSGAVITYAIALVVSAAILWVFGRFDDTSAIVCLSETIVLGVAATLGASAGRLLLQ
ncbi:TIGR02587 family membrane protein [Aliterella atlantica]|uniref:Membrane protein n=1 Tax=Aliterella atlantica CENA595 TaxID=1618023 RepID=A0A0D8ZS73_9CYAN|nr:TIGR02587 family membrane protein [Aliterella atlantica]KJH71172.1 membrane protein [Aliterella atlantica CENA595]